MRYLAKVAYDGRNYDGFQRQPHGHTIEDALNQAMHRIDSRINVVGASRTDAGVHAWGQFIHFDGQVGIAYDQALNTYLPKDIRIVHLETVADDFHARHSAIGKHYRYVVSYDTTNPFNEGLCWKFFRELDHEAMKQAMKAFVGQHDFTAYTSSRIEPDKPRVKTITAFEWEKLEKGFQFHIFGTGFLRYQVRMMVATLVQVGRHKLDIEAVKAYLDTKNALAVRYNAPAGGLYLQEVYYDLEQFSHAYQSVSARCR